MTVVQMENYTMLDEFRRCEPWIKAALERTGGTHEVHHVAGMFLDGRVHFWPMNNAFIITEFVEYPLKRNLHVWLAGGDLDEIVGCIPELEKFARLHNCEKLTMAGRDGWSRVLGKIGWSRPLTVMSKEIADG